MGSFNASIFLILFSSSNTIRSKVTRTETCLPLVPTGLVITKAFIIWSLSGGTPRRVATIHCATFVASRLFDAVIIPSFVSDSSIVKPVSCNSDAQVLIIFCSSFVSKRRVCNYLCASSSGDRVRSGTVAQPPRRSRQQSVAAWEPLNRVNGLETGRAISKVANLLLFVKLYDYCERLLCRRACSSTLPDQPPAPA